ncbi:MAG: histone deacetylase family protein [Candidatus Thorarchaeota archaeon]
MKILYHPLMQETYDRTPAGASGRLDSAIELLSGHPEYEFVEAREATEEEILYDSTGPGLIHKMASLAAGGSIQTAEIAIQGEPAFALVRPPGHHASFDSYWGFCYYNNIAVSLLHLRAKGLIQSAYILDFDLHTGDGNINILGDDPRFIIHNPSGNGDELYLKDVKNSLDSAPDVDIIVASAGFDQYEEDWGGNLSTEAFRKIGEMMSEFAKERCEGRRYGLLEGGYNFEDLGKNVLAFCDGLRI